MLISSFYPLALVPAQVAAPPAGLLAAWDQAGTAVGALAVALAPAPRGAQVATAPTWALIGGGLTRALGALQACSCALEAQTIAPGNWSLAFAVQLPEASPGIITWRGQAALYLCAADGTAKTTIFALADIGTWPRSSNAERSVYNATVAGGGFTAVAGDYITLELGLSVTNSAGGMTPTASIFTDGATLIFTDDQAASDARALLQSPVSLDVMQLVEPAGLPAAPALSPVGLGLQPAGLPGLALGGSPNTSSTPQQSWRPWK